MKKVFTIIFIALPFFLFAQNDCNLFEHTTIQIKNTNINTSESDFGPAFVNTELWYSAFTEKEIKEILSGASREIFYHLYSTPLNSDENLLEGKNIQLEEISAGYHAGPVSFCPATGELFVTLSNYSNPEIKNKLYRKANIHLKLIVVKKVNNVWKVTEELPFNNPTYSVGHPAIAENGNVLYFVSDKPGGKGGTDIYKSVRTNGVWGKPENLGDNVNTAGNEMFPFIYKDNLLIYSSNQLGGEDNLDMYYTCLSDKVPGKPVALTELNSPADDFGLVLNDDGTVGYFVSKKDGGMGDDDIYQVLFTRGEYKLELLVQDKLNQQPIPLATVNFSDGKILTTDSKGLIHRDLDYDATYTATSDLDGYMNESVSFSTSGVDYGVIKQVINVEKVAVGQKFVLENIFYDFDKWNILPESEVELNKLVKIMNDNPGWKVELGSHTDSRGSNSYNERLSQKRSDSAVGYIISAGISKDRIIAKGYGETQLVNQCRDGVYCTEQEHRQNRRTEFKILEMNKETGTYDIPESFVQNQNSSVQKDGAGNVPVEPKTVISESDSKTKQRKANKNGVIYQVQLIATSKPINTDYFAGIDDLIKTYGLETAQIDNLYKYRLGSFATRNEANSVRKMLQEKGFAKCFIVTKQ